TDGDEEMILSGPDERDSLYEVIDGQRVERSPIGAYEAVLATDLLCALRTFAKSRSLGRVLALALFGLDTAGKLQRRPNVVYVSYQRRPRTRRVPQADAWLVVPDLAVEIVSPSNTADEVILKVRDYFRAGTQQVWVFYPVVELVYVYLSEKSL